MDIKYNLTSMYYKRSKPLRLISQYTTKLLSTSSNKKKIKYNAGTITIIRLD